MGAAATFLLRRSSDQGDESNIFGIPTDRTTSGDHDGDGRDDLVTIRSSEPNLNWHMLERDGGGTGELADRYRRRGNGFHGAGGLRWGWQAGLGNLERGHLQGAALPRWSGEHGGLGGQNGDYPVANAFVH